MGDQSFNENMFACDLHILLHHKIAIYCHKNHIAN